MKTTKLFELQSSFPWITFLLLGICLSCQGQNESAAEQGSAHLDKSQIVRELELKNIEVINKTDQEWRQELTDKEYYILREKGTEARYSSDLLKEKRKGVFVCAACQLPLFDSQTKYKSGTGWPSFYDIIGNHVEEKTDRSHGMVRTEVICSRCQGHLGHVFSDGPKPTGLRYCINGNALDFLEIKE